MGKLFRKRKKHNPKPAAPQSAAPQQTKDAAYVQSFLNALFGALPSFTKASDADAPRTDANASSTNAHQGWNFFNNILKTAASFSGDNHAKGKPNATPWYTSMKNYVLGLFASLFKWIANFSATVMSWTKDLEVNAKAFQADCETASAFAKCANFFTAAPQASSQTSQQAQQDQGNQQDTSSFWSSLAGNFFS